MATMLYQIIGIHLLILFIRIDAKFDFRKSESSNRTENFSYKQQEENLGYRLPRDVVPKGYTITLKPHLVESDPEKQSTFDGSVIIKLEIVKSVPEIILHARELNFTYREIILKRIQDDQGESEPIETSMKRDEIRDFVKIGQSNGPLEPGRYKLEITKFSGTLNNGTRGFSLSAYRNEKGDIAYLATAYFEPIGARRAFPCFDEPHFKATFTLTIQHPINYNVISNMPPIKTNSLGMAGNNETTFQMTYPMPTHMLGFVVSNFQSIGTDNFKVYAKPNAVQYGNMSLMISKRLLNELETYTNISFKLPKMDQIAIPGSVADLKASWGLLLFPDKLLLQDDKTSITSEKQSIIETIARGLTHQWFGGLVSLKDWKFVWLNEGFAQFFQSYIIEQIEPKWRSIDQAVVKSIQTVAFDFDSSNKTHPIHQEVERPEEIIGVFDNISREKGGAIIRMMQHFLGNDVFKRGLNMYLTKKSPATADSNDLFQALDDAVVEKKLQLTDKLEVIMDAWVNREGYPVVTVTRNYNDPKGLKVEQSRFFSNNATENKDQIYYWQIPINFATTRSRDFDNTSVEIWLKDSSKIVQLSIEADEWVILNKQQTGFYRVNYDEKNWNLIISYLNSEERNNIHVLNRAQLINDALAFVKEGRLTLGTLLNLTSCLVNDTDYISWYPAFKSFSWIEEKLKNTENHLFFKKYALNTMQKFIDSVGLEESADDEHIDKLKRILAIKWSCLLGNQSCANGIRTRLEQWIDQSQSNSILPDLKQVILCEGLRTASLDLWKKVFDRSLSTTNDDEKSHLTSALGCSNNKTILQYYLNYTVDPYSKLNDTIAVSKIIRENSENGVEAILDFTMSRFVTLALKYKDEQRLNDLFNDVGEKITTQAQLDKLKTARDIDIPSRLVVNAIQAAEKNIEWLKQNEQILIDWKEEIQRKYGYNGAATISAHVIFILTTHLFFICIT